MSVESEERIAENTIEGNSAGTVKIASDVVATIAGLAAAEVKGIAGMSGGVVGGIGDALIYMNNTSTGGLDFITMGIKARHPHLPFGNITFAAALAVILLSVGLERLVLRALTPRGKGGGT